MTVAANESGRRFRRCDPKHDLKLRRRPRTSGQTGFERGMTRGRIPDHPDAGNDRRCIGPCGSYTSSPRIGIAVDQYNTKAIFTGDSLQSRLGLPALPLCLAVLSSDNRPREST